MFSPIVHVNSIPPQHPQSGLAPTDSGLPAGSLPVIAQGPEVSMPEPTGPYAVGRTFFEWTDTTRAERYGTDPEARRELAVWVWYPAAPAVDAQPDVYLPEPVGQILSQQFGVDINQIQSYAYDDASLAASDEPFPVLIFSHGTASLTETYSALLEELASHGYVVVGITHPYNAMVTAFSDGRIIPASPEATADESVAYWVEDTAFVVDQLAALNEGDGQFAGSLDLTRLGILGHSFGGATAADFCLLDARCVAGLNLDGTLWGDAGTQGVARPFMQIFSDHSMITCEDIVAAGGAPSLEACQDARPDAERWLAEGVRQRPGRLQCDDRRDDAQQLRGQFLPAAAAALPG